MAECCDLTRPEVRGRASLHADQEGFKLAQNGEKCSSRHLLLQANTSIGVNAVELKEGLIGP